jgi:GTP-binding protein
MNAGKSTLVNYLAQEDRVIVSKIPGTTRDSVDVRVEIDGQQLIVIDTAGLRKKQSIQDSVEFYGQARAARAIRRADVVLLMVDCTRDISQVDKQLANMVTDAFKPCVLCITKWDLAGELTPEHYLEYVQSRMGMLNFSPLTFISSKTAFNVRETFSLIPKLWEQANTRVPTAQINKVLQDAFTRNSPRVQRSRVPKISFGMQVDVCPPTILVFVNHPKLFNDEYRRYLANRFREALPYSEIPLRIAYRGKESKGPQPGP